PSLPPVRYPGGDLLPGIGAVAIYSQALDSDEFAVVRLGDCGPERRVIPFRHAVRAFAVNEAGDWVAGDAFGQIAGTLAAGGAFGCGAVGSMAGADTGLLAVTSP